MKRDWIVAGRRPAGICAAALLIASRAHGFKKQHQDVTKILRVCGMTVHQRVKDFENTPSANLTLEQFLNIELKTEADPPRFTANRIKEARAKAIQDKNIELLTSGKLDDPRDNAIRKKKWREAYSPSEKQKDLNRLYDQLATDMDSSTTNSHDKETTTDTGDDRSFSANEEQLTTTDRPLTDDTVEDSSGQLQVQDPSAIVNKISFPLGNNGKALGKLT